MISRKHITYGRSIGLAVLITFLVWAAMPQAYAQRNRDVRLDAGTVIPVQLNDKLSSSESRKGDTFTATVRTDSEGYTEDGLPSGSVIEGVVEQARSQRDTHPGVLQLSFRRIRTPNGRSYPIDGSLIGLDNSSVQRDSDGKLIAKPDHKKDQLTYVGYGAGAGLLVGLLTKHPLEDTILGGGLGFLFSTLERSHSNPRNVVLKQGTEMGVRLDNRVSIASYDEENRGDYDRSGTQYHRDEHSSRSIYRNPDEIGVLLGDRNVGFASSAPAIMLHGFAMVPAIPVLRTAHVAYTWNARAGVLTADSPDGPVRINVGSRVAVIDGSRRVRLDTPAQIMNGTIYVPARFLALATGDSVQYDASSRTVVLTPPETSEPDNENPGG